MSVTGRRKDLKQPGVQLQQRDIKCPATQVKYKHGLGACATLLSDPFVQSVCKRGGSRLIDDAHHVQPSDGTSVFGKSTLGVVEVSRHSHHSLFHLASQSHLGRRFHLLKHHGGDLLGEVFSVSLARDINVDDRFALGALRDIERHPFDLIIAVAVRPSDDTFDVEQSSFGVHGSLTLGRISDNTLVIGEGYPGGSGAVTLRVSQNFGLSIPPYSYTGICGSKIDTNDVFLLNGGRGRSVN
mmetsp:Transcript_34779/g.48217  ORF Transcript_34779/g.48217 Transcript_34779/m.48217 type:complete len:241 (-) Transcript_34779:623-1345(-)